MTTPTAAAAAEPVEVANDADEAPPIHALFWPQKEGDKEIAVTHLTIERDLEGRPRENAGKLFAASEFPDLEAIVRRFGGGKYIVKARTPRAVFIPGGAREWHVDPFEHPPLPLIPPPKRPPTPASHRADVVAPAPTMALAPSAPATPATPDIAQILGAIAAMNEQAQARIAEAHASAEKARAESAAQVLQVMQTMMQAKLDASPTNAGQLAQQQFFDGAAFMSKMRADVRGEVLAEMQATAAKGDDMEGTIKLLEPFLPGLAKKMGLAGE